MQGPGRQGGDEEEEREGERDEREGGCRDLIADTQRAGRAQGVSP